MPRNTAGSEPELKAPIALAAAEGGVRDRMPHAVPPELDYRFANPGFVVSPMRGSVVTRINTAGNQWVTRGATFDWERINLASPLMEALKHFIHTELGRVTVGFSYLEFSAFVRMQPVLAEPASYPFDEAQVIHILANFQDDRLAFDTFVRFYGFAVGAGVPGFRLEILRAVEHMRARRSANYADIRHRKSVLSEAEITLLLDALGKPDLLQSHYRSGLVRPELIQYILYRNNALAELCYTLGARPVQLSGVNEEYLHKEEPAEESLSQGYCYVEIPRAKQQNIHIVTKRRLIPFALWQKLERLREMNRQLFPDAKETALFRQVVAPFSGVFSQQPGDRLDAKSVSAAISNYLGIIGLQTRTAKSLRENAAQKLADLGFPADVIEEFLDHSDGYAARCYIQASLKLSQVQDQALKDHVQYQEWAGKLRGVIPIVHKADVKPGDNVISGVVNRTYIGGIGICGLPGTPCDGTPINSCYDCDRFHPFDDLAVHERVRDALQREKGEYLHQARDDDNPSKLAFHHDPTLYSIAYVMQQIRELRDKESSDD